jgi:hypothetical protein
MKTVMMKRFICLALFSVALAADCLGAPFFFGQQAAPPPAGGSTLLTGLGAHWKFNEASGNAADSSGNGNTLVNNAVATFAAGQLGNAAQLAGASSQFFSIVDNDLISTTTDGSFSGSFWYKLTDKTTHRPMFQKGWDNPYGEALVYYNDGIQRITFSMANGAATVNADNFGIPPASAWTHVYFGYDAASDTLTIRINHGTPNTASYAGGNTSSTGVLKVGLAFDVYMNGAIDDVAWWPTRVLTSTEQDTIWNGGAGYDF